MHLVDGPVHDADTLLQSWPAGRVEYSVQGMQIYTNGAEDLSDFIVQFPSQVTPFFLLDVDPAPGKVVAIACA